ncbi:MAG TPA: hypothetical protein VF062_09605 [Candidatus Limnocylindrales bacterium]
MIELRLFADYHQIHVFDEGSRTDLGDAWTEQATTDQVAVARDSVGVGTTVNVNVQVTVEVLQAPPVDDNAHFDHVVEASFHSSSGRVVVMGCTDYEPDAERFAVRPGWLRLRASRSNLLNAFRADVDSDEDPKTTEKVRLQIWPAEHDDLVVVRRWSADNVL